MSTAASRLLKGRKFGAARGKILHRMETLKLETEQHLPRPRSLDIKGTVLERMSHLNPCTCITYYNHTAQHECVLGKRPRHHTLLEFMNQDRSDTDIYIEDRITKPSLKTGSTYEPYMNLKLLCFARLHRSTS